MDSSYEIFNRPSTYFPSYSCPLADVSSFSSTSIRTDHENSTITDFSSYYSDTISHSPVNHSHSIATNRCSSSFSLFPSRTDRCLVCNDRSSGIHFGVSTCEACKAFFRRTSLSSYSIPLPCSPNRCEINAKNRNNCPSCRFDKCKRLGMDRDNVVYGKPSKQNNYFKDQLTNVFTELIKSFQRIDQTTMDSIETKLHIDAFGQIAFQLFYQQASETHISSFDVFHQILILISKHYCNIDYWLMQNSNLRAILSLWLFVYYYETIVFKQKISEEKLNILIKLLDMELIKMNEYYKFDQNKQKFFRIDFMNTFTKFSDLVQNIHLQN
ncbi:unnamed protein product [Adineta ricciae]|uniref:Nuclear receptor domain-containing protein n=1 Tax=Adineta ricciae TaxID=249248 RepID=A0A814KV89_ADIRI|nr:unnamed protein product [Adineta ricciae]CAF1114216.1 unnamed protein product [Adineta ricciae]